jgi:alpha-beta hydrolase superfamily lysophospholipase
MRPILQTALLAAAAPAAIAAVSLLAADVGRAGPAPKPDLAARAVMQSPAPPTQRYRARDGAELAYRFFAPKDAAAAPPVVAILLHGSAGNNRNMTAVGDALAAAGVPAFAPDERGQGLSGRRGDIDYIGQLDDDLAELVAVVRSRYPTARLVLAGHSSGGGFALRVAGEPLGRQFSRFVLLAPYLGVNAVSTNPDSGWARADMPRIVMLTALNGIGVTAFNGLTTVRFNTPPNAEQLGLTSAWSYRMMNNYGPRGITQLGGRPAYCADADNAPAPIVVIAGADDEQMRAGRYVEAFGGVARPPAVELVPGVSHLGVLADPRAVALTVAAIKAAQ